MRLSCAIVIVVCTCVLGCRPPVIDVGVSKCGGFQSASSLMGYCDAERIIWRYSGTSNVLTITHSRTQTNCSIVGETQGSTDKSTLEIVERISYNWDDGGDTAKIAKCSCVRDFGIEMEIDSGEYELQWIREKENSEERASYREESVYSGPIAISDGTGEIVVSDKPIDGNCE